MTKDAPGVGNRQAIAALPYEHTPTLWSVASEAGLEVTSRPTGRSFDMSRKLVPTTRVHQAKAHLAPNPASRAEPQIQAP